MVSAVGTDREVRFAFEQPPFALDREPAAVEAGAAGVRDQPVALDADRVFALRLLDRDVARDVRRIAEPVVAVAVRSARRRRARPR
ncbi:MAG: hypothetical protein DMG07_25365 [Acidobacteria bacterium]|nr:MAG: hypothetical protein DMG07_25365 [Acidobacteriota bacterium]